MTADHDINAGFDGWAWVGPHYLGIWLWMLIGSIGYTFYILPYIRNKNFKIKHLLILPAFWFLGTFSFFFFPFFVCLEYLNKQK